MRQPNTLSSCMTIVFIPPTVGSVAYWEGLSSVHPFPGIILTKGGCLAQVPTPRKGQCISSDLSTHRYKTWLLASIQDISEGSVKCGAGWVSTTIIPSTTFSLCLKLLPSYWFGTWEHAPVQYLYTNLSQTWFPRKQELHWLVSWLSRSYLQVILSKTSWKRFLKPLIDPNIGIPDGHI